ncbi:DUF6083 domain-containing protein [Streptomyces sp. NPDC059278]|uniref:DUF6083 domain-containing protein n=1 Tax=Streptomyces sp. NPDC059278 TaxID=3346801 RepID=UPI0036938FD2
MASLGAVRPETLPINKSTCKFCALPVQWVRTRDDRPIPMQPGEFPAWAIPVDRRWSFTRDRLHHAPWLDGLEKCRLVHLDVCPARPKPENAVMLELWERLRARAERQNGGIPVEQVLLEEEPEAGATLEP